MTAAAIVIIFLVSLFAALTIIHNDIYRIGLRLISPRALAAAPVVALGFNEGSGSTTADASGNNNTGTLVGGVTWTTAGKYGKALSFNGSSGVVRIPDSPSWKENGLTGYTVSMWVKVKNVSGDYKVALGKGPWTSDDIVIYKVGNHWDFGIRTTGNSCGGSTTALPYLTTVDNTYHHIAVSMNASAGQCQFYADGQIVDTDEFVSGTTVFATGAGLNNLYIGGLDGGQYLNADIDEVRVYKTALTQAEIQTDMNTPIGGAPPGDTTPPVISGVAAGSITTTSATITWTTNENSDSQVEYGLTTNYGQSTTLNPALVTAHSQGLSGLTAGTLYHYRVKSRDAAGNLATSADFSFTTAQGGATGAPVIALGFNEGSGTTTADASGNNNTGTLVGGVTWTTAGKYGKALSFNGSSGVVRIPDSPSWKENGLTGYTVSMWVKVKNVSGDYKVALGKGAWTSDDIVIYKVGNHWEFGIRTTGMTCGGSTTALPYLSTLDNTYHHIAMSMNASAGQCHFYADGQLVDTDPDVSGTTVFATGAGLNNLYIGGLDGGQHLNADIDEVRVYKTALTQAEIQTVMNMPIGAGDTTPPVISGVAAGTISFTTATITWTTSENSDSQVEYGLTTNYGQSTTLNPAPVTAHSQGLSGLTVGTLYHYRVKSRDAAGNLVVSVDFSFTTTPSTSTGNLALGKPASQSSTELGATANRAVDGNMNGDFAGNSVTHTAAENQAWWQVDLGSVHFIGAVILWNRTDCCADRLSNFYVLVSDTPFSSTDLTTTINQPGVSSYHTSGAAGIAKDIGVYRSGRYVRVQLVGNNFLHMAEVEVRGGGSASGCIASVPTNRWKGEYYNNSTLGGSPGMVRDDGAGFLKFDFITGSPSATCGLGVDIFSARWTRTVNFAAGTYRFSVTTDDGARLYIDGQLKIDKWFLQGATTYTVNVSLTAGPHDVKLEYFEYGGHSLAFLSWVLVPVPNCLPSAPPIGAAPRTSSGESVATTPVSEAPRRCSQKSSD